jgi:phosphoglycolate phosphatase-like HAD superfamily hydrolase
MAIRAARPCEPLVPERLIGGAESLARYAVEDCISWPSLTRTPVGLTIGHNHCIPWGGKGFSMQLFGHPLKLVILDVDGVILDLMAGFARQLETAAHQLDLPTAPIRDYLMAVHRGARHSFASLPEAIQDWWPALSQIGRRQFVASFRAIEREHPYPVVEGSLETIHWFRRRQVPMALCTTNDRPTLAFRLRSAGVDPGWFAAASTWESGHPKPDPKALDPIFAVLPVPREHAVYVGDWYPDVDAARGGGVRFIAVLSGGVPRHAFLREGIPEDHIIARLQHLPSLMQTP